jgi:hypothetical protein
VADALDTRLLHADLEIDCPGCEYPIWVMGAEVIAQAAVTCPCCRTRVWMIDADGGFQNAGRDIERHIEEAVEDLWR